eukprot:TRINITY_DN7744_c0_g1_i1.p1 TRINITY_DN7744_c0_g1~~TRINITY_DN7744_c0_g1_i1.p1  ORF type:complete len:136 (+),score=32.78 TRINITY_DN7744_c0_g1_i1:165-572(+)
MASRMTALVQALKQVAPKVMEHDSNIKDLAEKVGRVETEMELDRAVEKASLNISKEVEKQNESILARTSRLEVAVEGISSSLLAEGVAVEGERIIYVQGGEVSNDLGKDATGNGDVNELPEEDVPRRGRRASATE